MRVKRFQHLSLVEQSVDQIGVISELCGQTGVYDLQNHSQHFFEDRQVLDEIGSDGRTLTVGTDIRLGQTVALTIGLNNTVVALISRLNFFEKFSVFFRQLLEKTDQSLAYVWVETLEMVGHIGQSGAKICVQKPILIEHNIVIMIITIDSHTRVLDILN